MKRLYVDFETQSAVNLRTVGTKNYLTHPSTRIMSGVMMGEDLRITVWMPKSRLPKFGTLRHEPDCRYIYTESPPFELFTDCILVGHNSEQFDQRLLETLYPKAVYSWEDTIHLARANGYPAGLNGLLKALGMPGKGDNTAMVALMNAKVSNGRYVYPTGTMPLWEKLIRYNIGDVKQLKTIRERLIAHDNFDADITRINVEVNREGFRIDRKHLAQLRKAWEESIAISGDVIAEITASPEHPEGELNKDSVRSPNKVKAWLLSKGFWLPNNSLAKQKLVEVFAHPERYTVGLDEEDGIAVIALLAERQNAVSAIVGKLKRIADEMDDDDLVTHCYVQDGAHTGRSTAKVVQPHNFARGVEIKTWYSDLVRGDWTYGNIVKVANSNFDKKGKPLKVTDVLATLTRSVIVPTKPGNQFIVYDYAKIEAVLLAWFADCGTLLSIYGNPKSDVYCDMASKVFGRKITHKDKDERFIGKTIVLGCGYQMSGNKFDMQCRAFGLDLRAAGTSANECVQAFRQGYPEIPALWKGLNNSVFECIRTGKTVQYAYCTFAHIDGWLEITLPSGRRLRYRDTKIVQRPAPWNETEIIDQICYLNGYGITKYLYGGILAENIVQAASNDILRDAKKRLHTDRHPIRLEVHDELVFECGLPIEATFKKIGRKMSKPPKWGEGIPLMVEGFTSPVYTKNHLDSGLFACYLLGKPV